MRRFTDGNRRKNWKSLFHEKNEKPSETGQSQAPALQSRRPFLRMRRLPGVGLPAIAGAEGLEQRVPRLAAHGNVNGIVGETEHHWVVPLSTQESIEAERGTTRS